MIVTAAVCNIVIVICNVCQGGRAVLSRDGAELKENIALRVASPPPDYPPPPPYLLAAFVAYLSAAGLTYISVLIYCWC